MGYQLVAATVTENLSDEEWVSVISLASKYDFSAPQLTHLERRAVVDVTEEEASGLQAALERALSGGEPSVTLSSDETLDRNTVQRVRLVLRQPGGKLLRRTYPWH